MVATENAQMDGMQTLLPTILHPNTTLSGSLRATSGRSLNGTESSLDEASLGVSEKDYPEIQHGEEGIVSVATHTDASSVVTGIVGCAGLIPTVAASAIVLKAAASTASPTFSGPEVPN